MELENGIVSTATNTFKVETRQQRNHTQTSAFGAPGRYGHDSTRFYSGRLYEGLTRVIQVPYEENSLPISAKNIVFCKSSESMDELPDRCVHLMVTSPPYNVGKTYDQDLTLWMHPYRWTERVRRVWRDPSCSN